MSRARCLETWSLNCPRANNTGILTRLVPTLDLDLLQEDAAIAAENLVRERFDGLGSILCRIGRAPKRAIPFRTKDPFKKLTTLFTATNGADPEKIEFLADGQQVVAHGIHPDTQTEYLWDVGGDPTTIAYEKLPLITAEQAQQLQDDIVAMLVRDFGYVVGTPPKKTSTTRAKTARKNPKRDKAWAEAALEAECVAIANAMTGDRNAQLNLGAYNVFQIVWGNPGLLDEQEVRERLFAAAEACGLVADDGAESAWRTIESGCEGARTQPRVRPLAKLDQPAAPTWGAGLGLASAGASFGIRRCVSTRAGAWNADGDPDGGRRAPSNRRRGRGGADRGRRLRHLSARRHHDAPGDEQAAGRQPARHQAFHRGVAADAGEAALSDRDAGAVRDLPEL